MTKGYEVVREWGENLSRALQNFLFRRKATNIPKNLGNSHTKTNCKCGWWFFSTENNDIRNFHYNQLALTFTLSSVEKKQRKYRYKTIQMSLTFNKKENAI